MSRAGYLPNFSMKILVSNAGSSSQKKPLIRADNCAQRPAQKLGREMLGRELKELRLITCHLGNGCPLAAIRNGRSIGTTMGLTTPLDGLMMGSRSGSVDPGILIYLMRQQGYTTDKLDQLLNLASGQRESQVYQRICTSLWQGSHEIIRRHNLSLTFMCIASGLASVPCLPV